MSDELTCKWCEKSFRTERTLSAHMCPRKRRWADKDMTHVRLAHRTFQIFYEINTNSTKPKTQEDFIRSQYYEGFTKFGRSCILNEYMEPEKFAEWLIHLLLQQDCNHWHRQHPVLACQASHLAQAH